MEMMQDESAEIQMQSSMAKKSFVSMDESAEIQVQSSMAKKSFMSMMSSFYSEDDNDEGPDDEFRPVKISVITKEETRDEGENSDMYNSEEIEMRREGTDEERVTDDDETGREEPQDNDSQENGREVAEVIEQMRPPEPKESEDIRSVVSELTPPRNSREEDDAAVQQLEPDGTKDSPNSKSESLFDTSLLEQLSETNPVEDDDLSVVSKSVVDESSKNVEDAEALAEEMQRQLAESLADFAKSASIDTTEGDSQEQTEPTQDEKKLPLPSSSSGSNRSSRNDKSSDLPGIEHLLELPVAKPSSSASVSSSSTNRSNSMRRQRASIRTRRPSTAAWANTDEAGSTGVRAWASALPVSQQQQQILETVVIPAVFLIAAVAICRTFFHSWLKVGNNQSNIWALTWTILCIVAVAAPVFALEYLLLGGFLAGTIVQESIAKYPEVKEFLKDVRRFRLKKGWWYPSEVRTLRKDIESTNAEIFLQQQESLKVIEARDSNEQESRSIRRQISREEHRRERAQLEKVFDVERSEWHAQKEQLIAEAQAEQQKCTKLREQLETEQMKQAQLVSLKEQLENNIVVERCQWKFARESLEEAMKTAVEAQENNDETKGFYAKMEQARVEERILFDAERDGFQKSIKKAEEEAAKMQKEHEGKIKLFDDMNASKQAQWEDERKSLKETVKSAIDEARAVKDTLEAQICQLMDTTDAKYERQIKDLTAEFLGQKKSLKKSLAESKEEHEQEIDDLMAKFEDRKNELQNLLNEAKGEMEVSLQCVSNLQSVLEGDRTDWNSERQTLEEMMEAEKAKAEDAMQKLEHTETVFEEERATWEVARKTFEEALDQKIAFDGERVKKAANNAVKESLRATGSLQQELETKDDKIKALEESVQQLENIINIQEAIETSTKKKADREANKNKKCTESKTPVDGIEVKPASSTRSNRSIEFSSSGENESVSSDSSSYNTLVQKIQETHGKEQRQLLKGLLTQHSRWHAANNHVKELLTTSQAMLEVSEPSSEESVDVYHENLGRFNDASVSAKKYIDEWATKTGQQDRLQLVERLRRRSEDLPPSDIQIRQTSSTASTESVNNTSIHIRTIGINFEDSLRSQRSIATASNPWLKGAPLWQQVFRTMLMAKTSPFRICSVAVKSIWAGIYGNTLGMFHFRGSKQNKQKS